MVGSAGLALWGAGVLYSGADTPTTLSQRPATFDRHLCNLRTAHRDLGLAPVKAESSVTLDGQGHFGVCVLTLLGSSHPVYMVMKSELVAKRLNRPVMRRNSAMHANGLDGFAIIKTNLCSFGLFCFECSQGYVIP